MNSVRISSLCKRFENGFGVQVIFKNASLEVEKGDFVAILAPSGYGKTTLLNIIAGLDRADSGEIVVAGHRIDNKNGDQLAKFRRKNIGIVFQFFNLLASFTALENVMLPMELVGVPTKKAKHKALELLIDVGLEEKANVFPSTLSGGEQQRVAIARALANNPPIILADEPTGNLDEKNAIMIFDLLKEMNEKYGITIIVATHDVELATKYVRTLVKIKNYQLISMKNGM